MKKQKIVIVGIVLLLAALSCVAFLYKYRQEREKMNTQNQPQNKTTTLENISSGIETPSLEVFPLPSGINRFDSQSSRSATTSQWISRGGASDTTKLLPSDVIIAYSGEVLVYQNKTLGFEFGLPSFGKALRLNDSGSYSRRSDALAWIWFTKNYDIATANFFVTPTNISSLSELSFDYNFEGYPKYTGTTSRELKTVGTVPSLEETVLYESKSPDYPNAWKFIHLLRDGNIYTFSVQVEPKQALNIEEAEQMITVFKSTFHFLGQ